MSCKPTIVFDLDGTLADTIRDLVPSLNRTIATKNLQPVSASDVGHVSGKGIRAMIELAYKLNDLQTTPNLLDELFVIYMEDYTQNLAVHTVFYPGVLSSLQKFATHGWHLAVCTNKEAGLADKLLQELGARQMFSSLTGGDSFEFRKPDPNHLFKTIELAGGQREKAIMVGDSINDILTAQNANIPVIAVDFGYPEHPVETYGPDRIISGFDELFSVAQELIAAPAQRRSNQ